MPRRRPITDELMTHLETIRTDAINAHGRALWAGPLASEDLLGAIAWRSAFPEVAPFDALLRQWIEEARDRYTWIEISVACGDTPDRAGATRTQARQQWRNKLNAEG